MDGHADGAVVVVVIGRVGGAASRFIIPAQTSGHCIGLADHRRAMLGGPSVKEWSALAGAHLEALESASRSPQWLLDCVHMPPQARKA